MVNAFFLLLGAGACYVVMALIKKEKIVDCDNPNCPHKSTGYYGNIKD